MPVINYIESNGESHQVEVENGESVMQGAVDHAIEGIVAECGGGCCCATCHCYVDEAWLARVGEANPIEEQMLKNAQNPQANSRLSCQITVQDDLDGLVVRLPESQY